MFAATAFAIDSVLPLTPMLAHRIGSSGAQPRYFLVAFGVGAVLGSLPQLEGKGIRNSQSACRQAAFSLVTAGAGIMVLSLAMSSPISIAAVVGTGMAAVRGWASILAGLAKLLAMRTESPAVRVGVMMLWVVAWIATEPLASFMVGWFGRYVGLVPTAEIVTASVLALGLTELLLPHFAKRRLTLWGELVSRWVMTVGDAGQALGAATALQADPRSWGVTRVAASLTGFVARLTGDQDRYQEEFRSELYDLAVAGKGRRTQVAYILRLLLVAGSLRVETRSPRRKRAS